MHRGDHDHGGFGHHHAHGHDHGGRATGHPQALPGHNGGRHPTQWQTPHRPDAAPEPPSHHQDLDLVEASFIEGFGHAGDITSFLRLAGIPFVGSEPDGRRLHLLRVEIEDLTDVGSVVPLLGAAAVRYDPLPARFTSRRRRLAFAYHDGQAVVHLDFNAARALADISEPSHFSRRGD